MGDVLLVIMPFGAVDAPQISVSTIQAQLRKEGIPCDLAYLNFRFAEAIGEENYLRILMTSGDVFAGEWLFAQALFGPDRTRGPEYIREVLGRSSPDLARLVLSIQPLIEPFLKYALSAIDWSRYSIVGFTSMFEQNVSSLALARLLKERYPNKLMVLGGANCAGEMGHELLARFPFLDAVFTGESDLAFPAYVRKHLNRTASNGLAGFVERDGAGVADRGPAPLLCELDVLPYPDYTDYYSQIRQTSIAQHKPTHLLVETSRGCWWGQKHQCRFCGLNRLEIAYRAKTPERTLDELMYLSRRYAAQQVMAVDNILSMQYLTTLVPELRRRAHGLHLFYETKANLKRDQLRLLREAGVVFVQPGVESFSENTLTLMHKGVTPLQNAQLLKWCREFGVDVAWNILYGFPGENQRDYSENISFLDAMHHLQPPMAAGPVRLDRFSPIFDHPSEFGIRNVRPMKAYQYVYPFERSVLDRLAYFFDFDFDGKEKIDGWSARLRPAIDRWHNAVAQSKLQVEQRSPAAVVVRDTRDNRTYSSYTFPHPEIDVVDYCNESRSFSEILRFLKQTSTEPADSENWLRWFLEYLVRRRLMLKSEDRYLSLILPQPAPVMGEATWQPPQMNY